MRKLKFRAVKEADSQDWDEGGLPQEPALSHNTRRSQDPQNKQQPLGPCWKLHILRPHPRPLLNFEMGLSGDSDEP